MKWTWLIPAAITGLLLVLGPALARAHLVAPIHGFVTFAASILPGAVAILIGSALLMRGSPATGVASLIVGLAPLAVMVPVVLKTRDVPRINDISTNLDNPPVFVAAAKAPDNRDKDLSYPEAFKSEVQRGYPGLIALQLAMPPDAAFRLVKEVAGAQPGWTLTRIDQSAMTIEGEDTAGLFQFTDDFVIRLLALDGATQVDMRSRSRVGKSDFGANAARIRTFFAALETAKNGPTTGVSSQN